MNLPITFQEKMKKLLGEEEYTKYLESFEQKNKSGLRVNTSKISVEDFLKICPFELEPVPWTTNGFYYNPELQPAKHPFYFAGLYYLQEPSAMSPAAFLPVEEGERVLDLCAAPGGKTTELGVKLNGKGVLITNDISNSRAKALLKNVELFGLSNAIVLSEPPAKLASRFGGYFDKILIDAPCSGEGMFRKDPPIMKNWEKTGVEFYANLQREILPEAIKMLRPGGMLLYSTCTFSPEENEQSIEYLLSLDEGLSLVELPMFDGFDTGHPEWGLTGNEELKKTRRIWPHKVAGEGHYVALLKKSEDSMPLGSYTPYPYKKPKLPKEVMEFMEKTKITIDERRLLVNQDYVYYLPEDLADFTGLRTLRSGLFLGIIKKNRFEPSQALAMALSKEGFDNAISIEEEQWVKYLKCETIPVEGGKDGMALICAKDYPLGWGKNSKGTLKNKYRAGWRWL